MVEGSGGILAVSPANYRPVYFAADKQLRWPDGVVATCFSADQPESLRGPEHDHAWVDETGSWRRGPAAWSNLMFGLRLTPARVCITSTPRSTKLIKELVANPKTHLSRCSTYENRAHLAPEFFADIIAAYEGTRLGEQEIHAQLLEIAKGAWFPMFSVERHVSSAKAEYDPNLPMRIAIDAGASRHTGAVFFQVRKMPVGWPLITVFADYLGIDIVSALNAEAILNVAMRKCQRGPDLVRLDPAADAKTSLGPAAYGEYERVFGSRVTARWPRHPVVDGLDQIELMLGAPRQSPGC